MVFRKSILDVEDNWKSEEAEEENGAIRLLILLYCFIRGIQTYNVKYGFPQEHLFNQH